MRLRFEVNAPEKRTQRSLLIYCARKLVLCMFELSFCEVIELEINFYYLSYPLPSSSFLSFSFFSCPPLRVYGAVSMGFI